MLGESREVVHCICRDGYTNHEGIKITSTYPSQTADLITLYPNNILIYPNNLISNPFEMTEKHIITLENKGWKKIEKIFCE